MTGARRQDVRAQWPLRIAIGAVLAATAGVALAGIALGLPGSIQPVFVLVAAAYLVAGLLLVERQGANAIGPILLAIGMLVAGYIVSDTVIRQPDPPAATVGLALLVTLSDAPLFALVAFLFLLFPDGRLTSPRWRWAGVAVVVFGAASLVGTALIPGPFAFYPGIDNPLGLVSAEITPLVSACYLGTIGCVVLAVLSLVGRWRTGGPVERAQLKWVMTAAALIAAVMVSYAVLFGPRNFNDIADLAVGIAMGFFPIAIGIAILRYRLYEIDRLISRTIGWAIVTGILVAVFAVLVVGLQALLAGTTQGETLAVAVSTLAAFALFQPLRRRVQRGVDRRFDRARYDGDRVATAFAEHLRGRVDLTGLEGDLGDTVRTALSPSTSALWIRDRGGAR